MESDRSLNIFLNDFGTALGESNDLVTVVCYPGIDRSSHGVRFDYPGVVESELLPLEIATNEGGQ